MADAKPREPASSAEYNKVTANIRDLDERLRDADDRLRDADDRLTEATDTNARQDAVISDISVATNHPDHGNAALDRRVTTVETNQGERGSHGTVYAEIEALKAAPGGQDPPTVADDTTLYGDIISSRARTDCPHGETWSNGYMSASATISPKAFTATEVRFAIGTAAEGPGTFDLKVYTGPDLSSLAEHAHITGSTHVTTVGVKRVAIPELAISAGDVVAICAIVLGWTTVPKAASTLAISAAGSQAWIGEVPYSVYQGGRDRPPPATLDLHAGHWTRANQVFWFALA
ncbi:hypothetical protein [Amycolatopsis cihanbeyliensis]|nr:hypothetical protein [Amycolatopsis cihanbeyliensis]